MTSPLAWWRSPLTMLAAPIGLLIAAYVITGQFWTAAFIALVVACLAFAAAAHDFRAERDEARAERDRNAREAEGLQAELNIANGLLDARESTAPVVPLPTRTPVEKPDLRIIPPQRDGAHDALPVADEAWLDEVTEGRWTW